MNRPLYSVYITTFRGATHLWATIESVLKQDFTDFALMIIDDNLPDDTPQILTRYPNANARIRYIRNPANPGPQGN